METNTTLDQVKEIRNSKADQIRMPLKKTAFGGYDRRDTEAYIKILRESMQLSENAFAEKLEEYSSAAQMQSRERVGLLSKLQDAQKGAELFQKQAAELAEKIRLESEISAALKKENDKLKDAAAALCQQMENNEESQRLTEQIRELLRENERLKAELNVLTQSGRELASENALLAGEHKNIVQNRDRIISENEELKKALNITKITKRNFAMETNMKVYAYRQNHELLISGIENKINEILTMIGSVREEAANLHENAKLDPEG
ncbi:hypothetical protein SDC9_163470 [bioreactor metagenome]|uniref:Uncharacterized protein n=1 Tax=bioreactor metagenome TaxID=1076179 RepID=A0A645FR89_9ZZZZ